tara:strand:- start:2675 stop:4153 length:1479 start_codon:yes stop_codon:yes gene_type:complete
MNSLIPHKNTSDAVSFCEITKKPYKLISNPNYESFLDQLSDNGRLVFFPKTPETLSRVVVEARMMGMGVTVNKRIGASYEWWYQMKGKALIDIMRAKRNEIKEIVKMSFNTTSFDDDEKSSNLMLSYPRSGSTFVRYIIEYFTKRPTLGPSEDGVDLPVIGNFGTAPPVVFKQHAQDSHNKAIAQNLLDGRSPLIFLIRDPLEVLPRHTSRSEAESIMHSDDFSDIPDTVSYYFEHLQMYTEYEGKKQIFYYEDLVKYPAEFIKKMCDFLEVDQDGNIQKDFIENYEYHSNKSRSFYNEYQSSDALASLQMSIQRGSTPEEQKRETTFLAVKDIVDGFNSGLHIPDGDESKKIKAEDLQHLKVYDCVREVITDDREETHSAEEAHAAYGQEFTWQLTRVRLQQQVEDGYIAVPTLCVEVNHGNAFLKKQNPKLLSLFLELETNITVNGTRSDGKTVSKYKSEYSEAQIQTYWENFKTLCSGDSWKLCERYMK